MQIALIAAAVFVLIYNLLFYQTQVGVGTGIFFLVLNIIFFLFREKNSKNLIYAITFSILGAIFAFLIGGRASPIISVINLLASLIFSTCAIYLYKKPTKFEFFIPQLIISPFVIFIDSLLAFFNSASYKVTDQSAQKNNFGALIKGLIIAVPIFSILLFLLVQADPIFGNIVNNLIPNIGERFFISLILFIVIFAIGIAKLKDLIKDEEDISLGRSGYHELLVIVGSISALFAVFIFIQFKYLFSNLGERELYQLGIKSLTYSEYVNKGFFELIIASVISSAVMVHAVRSIAKITEGRKVIQALIATLSLEIFLLLLSAAQRVNLYQAEHGLTRARIFGLFFIIWLAGILLIFTVRIFKEIKPIWFFNLVLKMTVLVFLLINIINVDGLIANNFKPTVNNEIDYYYISGLSSDGVEGWQSAEAEAGATIVQLEQDKALSVEDNRRIYWAGLTLNNLKQNITTLVDKYGSQDQISYWHQDANKDRLNRQRKWQSFNLSEYLAFQTLMQNYDYFKQIPMLIERNSKLAGRVSEQVNQQTRYDRSLNPPLTPK